MIRKLDRLISFDERSRNFPIRSLIGATKPVTKSWDCKYWLDQGSEGACVGFGWAHELGAQPIEVPVTNTIARSIYLEAQKVDEWQGENYEGTSVLAGAKVIQSLGYMPEYRWAFSFEDAILTLGNYGPVVLGCSWYEGMWDTNSNGYVKPTGSFVGRHCVLVRGVAVAKKYVTIRNSWGKLWGTNGNAKISFADFKYLLSDQGEICVPVLRRS